MTYLMAGQGMYTDAREVRLPLKAGDLVLTFPDLSRRYGNEESDPDWHELYIIFEGPVFDLWRRQGLLDDTRPIRHLQPIDYWTRRLSQVATPAGDGQRQVLARVVVLQDILAEILDYERQQLTGHEEVAWLRRAYALLDRLDLKDRPDYDPLTEALGLSYAGFRSRFTRLAGISPGRYIAQRQIKAACRLLEETDQKLGQIAVQCGFTDQFHLSRRFKQLVSLTPREFRRRAQHTPQD